MASTAGDYLCERLGHPGRGFSIQTVSPLPIGWAEHVLADGHWGAALREYMRDYDHWATVGVLNELLPQPGNRVTLAEEKDQYGLPVARFDYSLCDHDQASIAYSTKVITDILHASGAQDVLAIMALAIMALASRLAARMACGAAMDNDPAARAGTAGAARSGGAALPLSTRGHQ